MKIANISSYIGYVQRTWHHVPFSYMALGCMLLVSHSFKVAFDGSEFGSHAV